MRWMIAVALGGARWETVFGWSMWTDLRWPASMKTLAFRTAKGPGPSKQALALFRAKLRGLNVELVGKSPSPSWGETSPIDVDDG